VEIGSRPAVVLFSKFWFLFSSFFTLECEVSVVYDFIVREIVSVFSFQNFLSSLQVFKDQFNKFFVFSFGGVYVYEGEDP